jgi:hypothetical protein
MPRSPVVYWRFGGTYCLHLQSRRVSPTRKLARSVRFCAIWRWKSCAFPKLRKASTRSHGFTSQNIVLFIVSDVGNSHRRSVLKIFHESFTRLRLAPPLEAFIPVSLERRVLVSQKRLYFYPEGTCFESQLYYQSYLFIFVVVFLSLFRRVSR